MSRVAPIFASDFWLNQADVTDVTPISQNPTRERLTGTLGKACYVCYAYASPVAMQDNARAPADGLKVTAPPAPGLTPTADEIPARTPETTVPAFSAARTAPPYNPTRIRTP
jgi:hypothetical protein